MSYCTSVIMPVVLGVLAATLPFPVSIVVNCKVSLSSSWLNLKTLDFLLEFRCCHISRDIKYVFLVLVAILSLLVVSHWHSCLGTLSMQSLPWWQP